MGKVGAVLRRAGVGAIYLAHGTLVGDDPTGLLAELGRVLPGASAAVRRMMVRVAEKITAESGNYSGAFARCLQASINRSPGRRIPVRLFQWSSENHHLGRADGAIRLIDELASLELEAGQRVLVWGHSHAGNVFALMTNLLGGPREAVERFFEAARIYYRWPVLGCIDIPVWWRVHELLLEHGWSQERAPLDLVTFGTPIRYGWESAGYSKLLHFVHHRPAKGLPEYRAPFPPRFHRVLRAADGDYVQQLGIAGTNAMPSVLAWRAWLADRRLHRLLQSEAEDALMERFQAGAIVPDEGTTLLVDYGPLPGGLAAHHAGHAVYTRKEWMLFHAEEVARQFYASSPATLSSSR
jgi:hypothetical protein